MVANHNGQTNVNAESAAHQPDLYASLSQLSPEDLGRLERIVTAVEDQKGGYLDRLWARPIDRSDYQYAERLLDCIVVQTFAALVRGEHISHSTIYSLQDSGNTDLFLDLRNGVLAGLQDAFPADVLALLKVGDDLPAEGVPGARRDFVDNINEAETPNRETQLQQIADLYEQLTPEGKHDFLAEWLGEHPDLLQQYAETVIIPKKKAEAQAKRLATLAAKKAGQSDQ